MTRLVSKIRTKKELAWIKTVGVIKVKNKDPKKEHPIYLVCLRPLQAAVQLIF